MNRLQKLFQEKSKDVLSIYFTAGYPKLDDTVTILQELQKANVDFVEIGMPFSDPVADGPVIQHSSEVALENGMTVKMLFEQLKDIRKTISMPLILMGYINPVLQYGIEAFCAKCGEIGIDGVILPDMPMEVFLEEYKPYFDKYDLKNIFLVTPQSSDERIKWIDKHSEAFIYLVSTYSTTGSSGEFGNAQVDYFKRTESLALRNPRIVGFGISNKSNFQTAAKYTSGAIIGSAFVKAIGNESKSLQANIQEFTKSILA